MTTADLIWRDKMNSDEQNIEEGIFVDTGVRSVPFEWNGKVYDFKVKNVPWVEKQKIMAKHTNAGRTGNKVNVSADMGAYHQDMLLRVLVDTGGMFKVDKINLLKLSDKLGEKLVETFLNNDEGLTEDEEKNCEQPSMDSQTE